MPSVLDDWSLPPIPPELKHLMPYFQRAQELRTRDPVMAYWCAFYGLQAAISIKLPIVNRFISNVLPVLEQIKAAHTSNETITNDAAAAAYVENFALRVFTMADNEDRKGLATRATAKKFLASANFLEVVQIFRALSSEVDSEKIRYAKWKAADIAKAFREGRDPVPGDAPSLHISSDPVVPSPPVVPLSLDSQLGETAVVLDATSQTGPTHPASVPLPLSDVDTQSPLRNLASWSPPHAVSHSPETVPSAPPSVQSVSPRTPSPRPFIDNNVGDKPVTPGMWSTMATPDTRDAHYADGPDNAPSSPNDAIPTQHFHHELGEQVGKGEGDPQDDAWSTVGNTSMSRQNSWTTPEINTDFTPPLSASSVINGLGLNEKLDVSSSVVTPGIVKRVHFSPSVVGGLSSASNSVAGSSPPESPGRYAPSLPTVDEVPYPVEPPLFPLVSPRMYPLPDSESTSEFSDSPQVIPFPMVHRVQREPKATLRSSTPSSSDDPPLPAVHHPSPSLLHQLGISSPQMQPSAFHSSPKLELDQGSITPMTPSLTLTQMSQVQKHCRFAISALDFEDTETARMELRKALAMLGG